MPMVMAISKHLPIIASVLGAGPVVRLSIGRRQGELEGKVFTVVTMEGGPIPGTERQGESGAKSKVVGGSGLEPLTSCVSSKCSNQLS